MNKGRDNKLWIKGYEQIVEICMAKKDFSGGLGGWQKLNIRLNWTKLVQEVG